MQPLQLSAYLSCLESLPKTLSNLCPTMAMFPTATLFFLLLVAFQVKNVDGVRGPTQASMLEREVTSQGKDPCEKYGAKRDEDYEGACKCPKDRPKATNECGGGDFFSLSKASKGCRCLTIAEFAERLARLPVAASALRFCEALVEHGAAQPRGGMDAIFSALKKTSPEICQHALVGTINKTEAEEAPWAEEASKISRKGGDEDGDEDEEYGRMRAVKEDATTPTEKALWEHALAQVCKDECEDLLDMMEEEAFLLAMDVGYKHIPYAQSCAKRVVQHVEAEILGCCARSCGFNGRTCLLWPFFSPKEKVEWDVECCGEMSVLKNSSRERMCNSVLPDRLAKKASRYDLEEQNRTDVGKVLIGQNTSLVWTREGIKFQFPKEDEEEAESTPREGDKVSMDFLLEHQKVGEEYLRLGYFREKPVSKMLDESTSLMEVSSQDSTCDFGKFKKQCPTHFVTNYMKTCQDSWNVAEEHEEHGDFEEQLKDLHFGDCSLNKPQYVAAPEDCDKLASKSSDEILVVYFTHEHDREEGPIACVTVGKKQCNGMAQWWKEIQLKSVQDMMNGPEIKDYTDRVYYVKVKADSK